MPFFINILNNAANPFFSSTGIIKAASNYFYMEVFMQENQGRKNITEEQRSGFINLLFIE